MRVWTIHRSAALGCFVAALCPRAAQAEDDRPLVTLSLSAAEVELGEPFFAYLEVSTARGTEVSLPRELSLGAAFEETRRKLTTTHPGDRDLYTFELKLMAFELGDLEIPEIPIVYASDEGPAEVRTATSRITIRSILAGERGVLRDVAPVVVVRRDMRRLYWSGGVVASALLLAFLALLLSRRTPRPKKAVDLPRVPPLLRARDRFEAIEGSLGDDHGAGYRGAYVELSEAVREYVGARFTVPALDATTAEIATAVSRVDIATESRDELVDWLRGCDLVKFAGYRASADEARDALYQARRWVEKVERARRKAERSSDA